MKLVELKRPIKCNAEILERLKDRKFFAISIVVNADGTRGYEHHVSEEMTDEEVIFGLEMLRYSIMNDCFEDAQ